MKVRSSLHARIARSGGRNGRDACSCPPIEPNDSISRACVKNNGRFGIEPRGGHSVGALQPDLHEGAVPTVKRVAERDRPPPGDAMPSPDASSAIIQSEKFSPRTFRISRARLFQALASGSVSD